ncbi:hypothetical protein RB195_023684 [Necator americanus]|uniref:Uncharacterized protein n=1 Tax=Necator americanus TaxID=51031 RepID=A0ABR1EK63_NECAM
MPRFLKHIQGTNYDSVRIETNEWYSYPMLLQLAMVCSALGSTPFSNSRGSLFSLRVIVSPSQFTRLLASAVLFLSSEEANMSERHIDISRSNYSVIDNEFGNMRDRFEAEMRRVEDEMKRLRQEFEGGLFQLELNKPSWRCKLLISSMCHPPVHDTDLCLNLFIVEYPRPKVAKQPSQQLLSRAIKPLHHCIRFLRSIRFDHDGANCG